MKLILLFLLVSISSCKINSKTTSYENDSNLLDNTWVLSSWKVEGNEIDLFTMNKINIDFDGELKRINGSDGCNQFQASYIIEKKELKLGEIGTTKMYCGEESSKQEQNFHKFIMSCSIDKVSEKELILIKDNNSLLFIPN